MVLTAILFTGFTFAQPVATVLVSKNDAFKVTASAKSALKRGMKLSEGDTIDTGSNGQVNLKYNNGTLVNLGPDSNYKILSYAEGSDVEVNAQLNKGRLYSKTTGAKKEALKTPAVALAILGTEYRAFVPSNTKTNCAVLDGKVSAYGQTFGPGESFLATPSGVEAAPFPQAGKEGTGNMDSSDSQDSESSASESESQSSDDSGSSSDESTSVELNDSGVSQVELISTSLVTTSATNSVTQASSSVMSMSTIEIISCMAL